MARLTAVSGRILIVDDDERQRSALTAMLSGGNYDTQVAADGLERLTTFHADVIVADLVMPRMDGFELLRHLKERGDLTPAIALTAFGSMEKALSVIHDLKAFWFLEKPVEPRAFQELLESAIRYNRSLAESRRTEARAQSSRCSGNFGGHFPGDATNLFADPAGGAHISSCFDLRRERHRQGISGAGDPQGQPAR